MFAEGEYWITLPQDELLAQTSSTFFAGLSGVPISAQHRSRQAPVTSGSRLRYLVAFFVAASVTLTAIQQFVGVGPWWLELSRYLPYPAVLAPTVLALLLSLRIGVRWVLMCGLALVMVVVFSMGFEWNGARGGDSHLRLMTYNIKAFKAAQRGGGFDELAQEVALHDPDILVMQDAGALWDSRRSSAISRGPVFGLPEVYAAGQYIVASRFPLRRCAVAHFGARGDDTRYVHCVVMVRGVELNVVTAHFESPRDGLNAARHEGLDGIAEWRRNYENRLAQARALAIDLRDIRRPLIVAGDLNAPESSPVIRALLPVGLRDAFSSVGRGFGYSYGHALRVGFSFLRIDHILVSPEIGLNRCFAGNAQASEHRPVIADLTMPRPEPREPRFALGTSTPQPAAQ